MVARWSRPVSVRRITKAEALTIEADAEERAALADALDLLALDSLGAELRLAPWRGEGIEVAGEVRGEVVQACVVTLEPVAGRVAERFVVRLHPDAHPSDTVDVDPEADDPPEPLESETVDVGAIALEHFVLGLDPYPRADGAEFVAEPPAEDAEPSPFAVLGALKKSPG